MPESASVVHKHGSHSSSQYVPSTDELALGRFGGFALYEKRKKQPPSAGLGVLGGVEIGPLINVDKCSSKKMFSPEGGLGTGTA